MAIVKAWRNFLGVTARGKVGRPGDYGRRVFGYSKFGEDVKAYGIYQMRHSKKGKINVLSKYYWPTNPNSPEQAAGRSKFAAAVSAWQGLTDGQKAVYNKRANKKRRYGYWDFIQDFMKNNPLLYRGYGVQLYGAWVYGDLPPIERELKIYGQSLYADCQY